MTGRNLTPTLGFRREKSWPGDDCTLIMISPEADLFMRLDWQYGDAAVRMSDPEWDMDLERWHNLGCRR